MGILSPYNPHPGHSADAQATDAPVTPPETPAAYDDDTEDLVITPPSALFHEVRKEELNTWAEARGRWLFV